MTSENPMEGLYERLAATGLTRHYVKKNILPDWWDDRAARNPVGYREALGYVSKHTGLSLHQLKDEEAPLNAECASPVRFKARDGISHDDLTWAKSLAVRATEMAAYALEKKPAQPVPSAERLRQRILEAGHRWVDFDTLLDTCWDLGIPVLHLSRFPKGGKKMDGMAVIAHGRPAIVISKKHKHDAWLSFICAHELGHIGGGHLSEGEALADKQSELLNNRDRMEREANNFAAALLTDGKQFTADYWPNAEALAEDAHRLASQLEIEPGAVVLNFVWHATQRAAGEVNLYPLANKALNLLYPEADGAHAKVRQKMFERLPLDRLPDESASFLLRLTGGKDEHRTQAANAA